MGRLRTYLTSWWRRMNSLEAIPKDAKHSGHGIVPDPPDGAVDGSASDLLKNLPPGAGGSGI
jgi:hypothetical protein